MISRHRKFKFFTLTLLASLLCTPCTITGLAPSPVDYLVPPPPPLSIANIVTRFQQTRPQSILPSESKTLPFINTQLLLKTSDQKPGLMTRVARWFGFTNQNVAANNQKQLGTEINKQTYYYSKPQQQQQYVTGDKESCSLCNKYPWVPMMQNNIHYPVAGNQWDTGKQNKIYANVQQYQSNTNTLQQQLPQLFNFNGVSASGQTQSHIQHSASNIKQRAVKFNFPIPYIPQNLNKSKEIPNHIQYPTGPFLPLPPLLSNSALPPLYNAQKFVSAISLPNTIQQLPSTKPAHFAENIADQSEIHVDTKIPSQISPTIPNKDASFEIVKSHQLVDYVSSVEYPASYVPSHSFDISTQSPSLPLNHQSDPKISTGFYQHSTFRPDLNQHIPASQILTDPGSFAPANQQQHSQQADIYEQTTIFSEPQFLEHIPHFEYDNYVAASHQNSSILEHQQPQTQVNLDTWTLESNDYVYETSTPVIFSTTEKAFTITTEFERSTEPEQQYQNKQVEIIASIQTNAQQSNIETTKLWSQKPTQRETPKRLLDSPIQHINGNFGEPRPFTRDPSDLTFRLGAKNHKFSETFSQETWKPQMGTPDSSISTSTYSSLDASGQYVGMSPPSLPSTYNNNELISPFLVAKNRPRPFETTHISMITKSPSTNGFSTWSQEQNVELHTPQETMLIKSHIKPEPTTTTPRPKPRTTKYLTKFLASNLRELLQREHEPTNIKLSPNSFDIDINKLQKNIDDWTEQEYSSLSHKPSTPTIRGRSKHIPTEYLPTTMAAVKAARQSKTTNDFSNNSELPSSINNLEPLYERESTKHFQYTHITDNHLRDFYDSLNDVKLKSPSNYRTTTPSTTSNTMATTTTTTATTTTEKRTLTTTTEKPTTTTTTEKPIYLRYTQTQDPEELWKKAKVSISPKTQEKIYVVTPQPRFFPQRFYSPTTETTTTATPTTTERPVNSLRSNFKSPRFLVRPTPGNAHKISKISDTESKETSKENQNKDHFTSEWFGLKGLSAYVPSQPVEIIDGNSKVLNTVTMPSNMETTTKRHNIMDLTRHRYTVSKRKPTMAPSPR